MTDFIDLHVHSTFSSAMTSGDAFGTPQMVVDRAVELKWDAVCLTDHGWMGGIPALYKAAKIAGIKPIFGCELYVTPDHAYGIRGKEVDGLTFHLTVLALSKEGYENLVAWTTDAMRRDNYHRKPRISLFRMAEIAPHPLHHNVVLSGCLASELCRVLSENNGTGLLLGASYIEQMKMLFPNFYIELCNHEIPKFMDSAYPAYVDLIGREGFVRERLIELARMTDTPMVLTNDSHMQRSSDRKSHIALKSASWRGRDDEHMTDSNARAIAQYLPDYGYFGNYMRSMDKIAETGIPDECAENVAAIVEEANIILDPLDSFTYSIPFSGYDDPIAKMRKRSAKRLKKMVKRHGEIAAERFELELEAMGDFAHYLLLMSDFIREARKQGILTWTRGSAANSFLCYCLGIHEIDSIGYELVFSRFFNPARKKLPDIDLDIQPSRYDDFMQIVHRIMEPLVGKGQVVQISNWGTSANRKAFRTAATALGMPKEEQDEIAKLLPQMIDSGMADEDTDIFLALREDYPDLYEISSQIFDSVTNVSQHACAWVFGTPERPVAEWVPLYLIASSGTLVTQYDYKTLEDFGLTKMDFLRLKTLDVAAKTMQAIGRSPLEFHDIPLEDEATFEMMRSGKVEGVHTVQGKEVRRGVMEMEAECVDDVIVAAALYRPANTREGKDKLYVERRRGLEIVSYPHEIVEQIVGKTLGVPVFQEDAMELCYAAGADDEFVDDVYQAIKKAKGAGRGAKELFSALEPRFVKIAKKHLGITKEDALEIWEFIKAFQGYGFNKGHATSYGLLAYLCAYLKCHHPAEFFASLLDVFPERYNYIAAARAEGFEFLPPDVNRSGAGFAIDKLQHNSIRVGLGKLKGLGPVAVKEILNGAPFSDYDDFKKRTTRRAINAPRLENLGRLGTLESLGVPKDKNEDEIQVALLGFTLKKPKAFKGIKPSHTGARSSDSGWKHFGRERGVDLTPGRGSVSKLFWFPNYTNLEEGSRKKYMELKASPWAQVKTWLLTAIDENGIPFHIMVNEDKLHEVKLLNFFYSKCQDGVACLDGMIRMPFVQNGPQGFRLFGVTGAYQQEAQLWTPSPKIELHRVAISELTQQKRRERYAA